MKPLYLKSFRIWCICKGAYKSSTTHTESDAVQVQGDISEQNEVGLLKLWFLALGKTTDIKYIEAVLRYLKEMKEDEKRNADKAKKGKAKKGKAATKKRK